MNCHLSHYDFYAKQPVNGFYQWVYKFNLTVKEFKNKIKIDRPDGTIKYVPRYTRTAH